MDERVLLPRQFQEDKRERRRNLPDLAFFMLLTGVRMAREQGETP